VCLMSSPASKTIFNKIDAAVLLAAAAAVKNEHITTNTLAMDNPKTAAQAFLGAIHMMPLVREPLVGSGILHFKEDTLLILIKQSIRRLVRHKKLVGYTIEVPTMLLSSKIHLLKSGHTTMRKVRRYKPINALEALARL